MTKCGPITHVLAPLGLPTHKKLALPLENEGHGQKRYKILQLRTISQRHSNVIGNTMRHSKEKTSFTNCQAQSNELVSIPHSSCALIVFKTK